MKKEMLLDMFLKEGATVAYKHFCDDTDIVTLATGEVVKIDTDSIETSSWLAPLDGLYLCDFVHEDATQVYVIFEYSNCFMTLVLRHK